MKNPKIELKWKVHDRKIPDYNGISLEMQKEHKIISNIIANNRFLFNALKEINKTDNGIKIAHEYAIFSMINNAFYFQFIVVISKIFNNNETYSLYKFINKLKNDFRNIQWYESIFDDEDLGEITYTRKISKEDLNKLNEDILEGNLQETYLKFKIIRDEYLAHSDRNPTKATLHLDELDKLQNHSEEVINKLGNVLYGTSTAFMPQDNSSLELLLKKLTAFDQIRDIVNNANTKNQELVKTDHLLDIIRFKTIN